MRSCLTKIVVSVVFAACLAFGVIGSFPTSLTMLPFGQLFFEELASLSRSPWLKLTATAAILVDLVILLWTYKNRYPDSVAYGKSVNTTIFLLAPFSGFVKEEGSVGFALLTGGLMLLFLFNVAVIIGLLLQ